MAVSSAASADSPETEDSAAPSSPVSSLFSVGLMPAEREANKGCRARVVVRVAALPDTAAEPRAADASPSVSNPPTRRNPRDADVLVEASTSRPASVSPNVRLRRRESAEPHPRATRVAARSNSSAIFAPPGRISNQQHRPRDT